MKIHIVKTADQSIQIRFYDKKIKYELEFFDDGDIVFCKTDNIGETIDDIQNTRILFKYLTEIEAYNKTLNRPHSLSSEAG